MPRTVRDASQPLAEVDLDPRPHYKRMVTQSDEIYRKYRWQVAIGGPDENPTLYAAGRMAHNVMTQAKDKHFKDWRDFVNYLLAGVGQAQDWPEEMRNIEADHWAESETLINFLLSMNSIENIEKVAKLTGEVIGRSAQVAFLHARFMAEVEPEVKPKAEKTEDSE